jgi:hypothetical protein
MNSLHRTLTALIATLTLLLVGSVPAQAEVPTTAPRGYVTFWEYTGFGGGAYLVPDDWTGCRNLPSVWNDRPRSIANNTATPARNVRVYKDSNCRGTSWYYYAGTSRGSLSSSEDRNYSSYNFAN